MHMATQHPPRPFLLDGDYPAPTPPDEVERQLKQEGKERLAEEYANVQFDAERREREALASEHSSGKLGSWNPEPSPLSPGELERQLEEDARYREQRGGLPDSSEQMPAVAVKGGFPAKFD